MGHNHQLMHVNSIKIGRLRAEFKEVRNELNAKLAEIGKKLFDKIKEIESPKEEKHPTELYKEETGKNAIWKGKPTKAYQEWLKQKNDSL